MSDPKHHPENPFVTGGTHHPENPFATEPTVPGKASLHAEYQSGALQKRMEGANARDRANAQEPTEPVSLLKALGLSIGATGANLAQGIPGMEMAQAGARSVVRGQPYGEALGDVRGQTAKIPKTLKTVERVAGALPTAAVLPANPALAGAVMGAADGALGADEGQSLAGRAGKGAAGGIMGAVLGKAASVIPTTVRAAVAKTPAANILARTAQRGTDASRNYMAALSQGVGKAATPAEQTAMSSPDVAEVVDELLQTRPFKGVARDDPSVLDAAYKVMSDRAAQLKKSLSAPVPNKPNIGRYHLADTRMAQGELLDAATGTPAAPGRMPLLRPAVEDYAKQSSGINAVAKGSDAMRGALAKNIPMSRNLTKTSPEAIQEWAASQPDAIRSAAGEGVLGGVKMAGKVSLRQGVRAAMKAPGVLRTIDEPTQALTDYLVKSGLLTLNAEGQ